MADVELVVTVRGTCGLARRELVAAAVAADYERVLSARGDFVVAVTGGPSRDVVLTSRSGVVNHFWAVGPAGMAHGSEVAMVARAAGLPWRWDGAAIADHLRFGFPLGTATVHRDVRRLPAGTAVDVSSGEVLYRYRDVSAGPVRPADAVAAVVAAVEAAGEDVTLSMSGGLDSRVLLAALLAVGRRPALLVCGVPGSFDRVVSAAIADRFALPLAVVEITAEQVLAGAVETVCAANGLLPATNWAGMEHLRSGRSGRTETDRVMFGYNGEFARSYYACAGGPYLLRQVMLPRNQAIELMRQRFPPPFSPAEAKFLDPALRTALSPAESDGRLDASMRDLAGDRALDVTDEFFLTGFGPQKTGANLAAIGRYTRWSVPLFDHGWVEIVRRLPRRWKIGDRLHRYLIAMLQPDLLDFPDEGYHATRTSRRPPWQVWTTGPGPGGPHHVDQSMFRGDTLLNAFQTHRDAAADLIAPELLDRLAAEQVTGSRRPHVAFGILALAMLRSFADR